MESLSTLRTVASFISVVMFRPPPKAETVCVGEGRVPSAGLRTAPHWSMACDTHKMS